MLFLLYIINYNFVHFQSETLEKEEEKALSSEESGVESSEYEEYTGCYKDYAIIYNPVLEKGHEVAE